MNELLLKEINNLYQIKVKVYEKVTRGVLSENHILYTPNSKYFLKKYRFDNQEKIEEIHSVKKYFSQNGIPIILPILNNKKNTFFCFENSFYAIFPFIQEKHFERGDITETGIKSLAETLGCIHLAGKKSTLKVSKSFGVWNKEKSLKKIELILAEINKKPALDAFDSLALETVNLKKKLITSNSITYEDLNLPSDHLTHGDYLDHNVFFDKNDKVVWVFDFEKADMSPRVYELFRSMAYTFMSDGTAEKNIMQAKLYIDTYTKTYPMTKDEIERGLMLFYLKSIHGTWVEGEHYLEKNYRSDHFLSDDFKRLKYFSENIDLLKKKFA